MRIYRASELGGCVKAQVAKQLGFVPKDTPEKLSTVFREGNLHEEDVVAQLREGGEPVAQAQTTVSLPINGECQVEGHIDGIVDGKVLEIKSMSDTAFKEWKRSRWEQDTPLIEKYKWQISVYMVALGMEALYVVKNRNTGEINRTGIEVPWYGMEEIRERVLEIERWVNSDSLPERCNVTIYPCPYYYLHEKEEEDGLVEDGEIEQLASTYKSLQALEKKVKGKVSSAYKDLRSAMGERRKVDTGKVKVTVYDVKGRESLDQESMRADGVDITKYLRRGDSSTRMRVDISEEESQ